MKFCFILACLISFVFNLFFICAFEWTVAWLKWSHGRVLVDIRSRREDVSADVGEDECSHYSRQQSVHQHQVLYSRPEGEAIAVLCLVFEGWSLYTVMFQVRLGCFWTGGNAGCACRSVRWARQTGLLRGKVRLLFTASEKKHANSITVKNNGYSHSVVKKVAHYMADVIEDSRDKVMENLLANGGEYYSENLYLFRQSLKDHKLSRFIYALRIIISSVI